VADRPARRPQRGLGGEPIELTLVDPTLVVEVLADTAQTTALGATSSATQGRPARPTAEQLEPKVVEAYRAGQR
jgi:hypothetical protein